MILEGEHCFAIAKLLLLIYRTYSLFSPAFKKTITMYLLGQVFFKLFLHWANNIRFIFQHLLIYRVHYQSNLLIKEGAQDESSRMNDEIRSRYRQLIIILKSAEEVRANENINKLTVMFEKDYYRRMRNKLVMKKNQSIKSTDFESNKYALEELSRGVAARHMSETLVSICLTQLLEVPILKSNASNSCPLES